LPFFYAFFLPYGKQSFFIKKNGQLCLPSFLKATLNVKRSGALTFFCLPSVLNKKKVPRHSRLLYKKRAEDIQAAGDKRSTIFFMPSFLKVKEGIKKIGSGGHMLRFLLKPMFQMSEPYLLNFK
jgi:hypothetical protein